MFPNRYIPSDAAFYPYKLGYSCRFNDDDSAKLSRFQVASSTNNKIYTLSIFTKRGNLGSSMGLIDCYVNASNFGVVSFNADDRLLYYDIQSGTDYGKLYTRQFRDPTSWYHILIVVDTPQATASDRLKIYVNGEQITDVTTDYGDYPQNQVTYLNSGSNQAQGIGLYTDTSEYYDGYFSEMNFIDGQALSPSDFGETKNGIWIPSEYGGTYGSNGFYLDFANSVDLGNDVSGNSNDFTTSGLTSSDQVDDVPTNNYCNLNEVNKNTNITLSNGNLGAIGGAASWYSVLSSLAFETGKWYAEVQVKDVDYTLFGVSQTTKSISASTYLGDDTSSWSVYTNSTSDFRKSTGGAFTSLGGTPAVNDIMQIAIDADAGKIWFGVNNSWFGSGDPAAGTNEAYSGLSGELTFGASCHSQASAAQHNFGQLGFTYTPPTGFKSLCTENLSNPSIPDSSNGFYAANRTGTGAESTINDVNFNVSAGSLIWIKNRDAANEHKFIDTERGVTKELSCDSTNVESTDANGVTAFSSSGYTVGTGAGGYNDNTEDFVDSVMRKGSDYGLDIVLYSGTGIAHAVNHGLGAVPEIIIVKNRDAANGWCVYHSLAASDPETDYARLDDTAAFADDNTVWNDTAPTTTQFTVGTSPFVNTSGENYVAYVITSVYSFLKVFSYTGNGSTDGPYINLSFKPSRVIVKGVTGVRNWAFWDSNRDIYNVSQAQLFTNSNSQELTSADYYIDLTSQGFKLRGTGAASNANAVVYIGIAFAEQPGKWSNAR